MRFSEYPKEAASKDKELLKLTGIFGIHPISGISPFFYWYAYQGDDIIFEIKSDVLKKYSITIDQKNRFILLNRIVKTDKPSSNLAFRCVKCMAFYGGKNNYSEIQLNAWRNDADDNTNWIGYFIWGKYGFLMKSLSDNEKVIELATSNKFNLKENNIYGLVCHKEGFKKWIQEGKYWLGIFNLTVNSDSNRILAEVSKKKRRRKMLKRVFRLFPR